MWPISRITRLALRTRWPASNYTELYNVEVVLHFRPISISTCVIQKIVF